MLLSTGSFFGNNISGGPAPAAPLDGFSPTCAISPSRNLLTAWGANARYSTGTGISALKDQSGNGRDFSQATGANQPTLATAGPNGRACADFDGSNDAMDSAAVLSSFIANNAGFAVASIIVDAFGSDASAAYLNPAVFIDSGLFAGLTLRSNSGSPLAYAYNWDSSEDRAQASIVASTPYVLTWRHESGNLYVGVNGVESAATASGNTSTMTGTVRLGYTGFGTWSDIKLFEFATFSTVPSSGDRSTIINAFKNWIGA